MTTTATRARRSRRGPCAAPGCTGNHRAHPPTYLRPLPEDELMRLRRMVGVPDTGPTPEQVQRWNRIEAQTEARL